LGVKLPQSPCQVIGDANVVRIPHQIAQGDVDRKKSGREKEPEEESVGHGEKGRPRADWGWELGLAAAAH